MAEQRRSRLSEIKEKVFRDDSVRTQPSTPMAEAVNIPDLKVSTAKSCVELSFYNSGQTALNRAYSRNLIIRTALVPKPEES